MEVNRTIRPRLPHRLGVRRILPIPVAVPVPAQSSEVAPATTSIPATKLTPSLIPAKKEKKENTNLKKNIKVTKFVRLQWKKPEVDAQGNPNLKGTFVGCNGNKGKVNTKAGRGIKGVWIVHELETKEVILEPLNNTGRFLRMFPEGRVNLTQKGAGVRAKWRIVKEGSVVGLADVHKRDVIRLESLFVKDTILGIVPKMTKKNALKLKIGGVPKSSASTENTFTSFTVEEVNTTRMLTFAVNHQNRCVKPNKFNKNKTGNPNKGHWKKEANGERKRCPNAHKMEKCTKRLSKLQL